MWRNRRLLDLFRIEVPIVLAPMAGAMDVDLAVAVAEAGGLASLPFAMLNAEQARSQITDFRSRTSRPLAVGFFLSHAAGAEQRTRGAVARAA